LFSKNALRRAWKLVQRNGPSPGSDGVTPAQFADTLETELRKLRWEIIKGEYLPRPVRRFYVTKSSGKRRRLTIWAVRDRVAQRHLAATPQARGHSTPPAVVLGWCE